MSPRQSIDIATAALRWHMARERCLAAGAVKPRADTAYKARWTGVACVALDVGQQLRHADAALAETQRQDRAAVHALTKACTKTRRGPHAIEVLDLNTAPAMALLCLHAVS